MLAGQTSILLFVLWHVAGCVSAYRFCPNRFRFLSFIHFPGFSSPPRHAPNSIPWPCPPNRLYLLCFILAFSPYFFYYWLHLLLAGFVYATFWFSQLKLYLLFLFPWQHSRDFHSFHLVYIVPCLPPPIDPPDRLYPFLVSPFQPFSQPSPFCLFC